MAGSWKQPFAMTFLWTSIGFFLIGIFAVLPHLNPILPPNAVWEGFSDFGRCLLLAPCFLGGLFLGQLVSILFFWRIPQARPLVDSFLASVTKPLRPRSSDPIDGKSLETTFGRVLAGELRLFGAVLLLVSGLTYIGLKNAYFLSPDGAHFSSAFRGTKNYPWTDVVSVEIRAEKGTKADSLYYILRMKNGDEVDLVQENFTDFMRALPMIDGYLSLQQNVRFICKLEPGAVKDITDSFGAGAVKPLFQHSAD